MQHMWVWKFCRYYRLHKTPWVKVGNAGVLDIEVLSPLWPFLVPDDATWWDTCLIQLNLVERFKKKKKKIPTILFPR